MSPSLYHSLHQNLHLSHRQQEETLIPYLLSQFHFTPEQRINSQRQAEKLIKTVRQQKLEPFSVESFLQTYPLDSQEGIALMCLAEALLRIPDRKTQDTLIRSKIASGNWGRTEKENTSWFSHLTSMGLQLTDILLKWGINQNILVSSMANLSRKITTPLVRQAIHQAMKILGQQFVLGQTINQALINAQKKETQGYLYSYDMLGEGAKTASDAQRYFDAYLKSISEISRHPNKGDIFHQPSLSIKLSALHPRYEILKKERAKKELFPLILELCQTAKANDIGLTIDAEESFRLELSLELFAAIASDPSLKGWDGLGLAVQAYQKRCLAVVDWLCETAKNTHRRLPVRLVKGAYWDTEIKQTQEQGLVDYPVFTRKVFTDLSYFCAAEKMLAAEEMIYPQFATHNAYTVATLQEMAAGRCIEFQRLHGMGEHLHDQLVSSGYRSRIYAPVGEYQDLLAYLVRRLLENGSNSSFVHKLYDPSTPLTELLEDPIETIVSLSSFHNPAIPLPKDLLQPQRENSKGIDLSDQEELQEISAALERFPQQFPLRTTPLIAATSSVPSSEVTKIFNPANSSQLVGLCDIASAQTCALALDHADHYKNIWVKTKVDHRAHILKKWAELLEEHKIEFINLLVYEAGKTVKDAIAEIREAVDFCYYYAKQACLVMKNPLILPGPTGEKNELSLHGRGVFVCISPWNFPLAIFLGQVAAALVTGNTVIAKPAQQTPYIAYRACQLAFDAGLPPEALQFLPVTGKDISQYILSDNRVHGVAFTGSHDVARAINQTLSQRTGSITPFIAETGGINAMIVDSSALSEQVVTDIITSAFQSAGQRCSALRLLFIQEDVADKMLHMLAGAMQELKVGHPCFLDTDIGPVISNTARQELLDYIDLLSSKSQLLATTPLSLDLSSDDNFIAPQVWHLSSAKDLDKEIFGPILHIVRFQASQLKSVIESINAKGHGLTLGLHSRIDETIDLVRKEAKVGNLYVNRNMIGAVVGVQPFGGEGLSGTGPKAGGPHYLYRFMVERTFTQDMTAAGGNTSLLTLSP